MVARHWFFAFLFSAPAVLAARREQTNPLGKVLQLLDDLTAKITKEGAAEAKAFKEYVEWCDDTTTETGFEIKTLTSKQAKLEAKITKLASDVEAASTKIEELAASISKDSADLKAATSIRQKEAAVFAASEGELLEVIDSLSRASAILSREMAKNPAAFAQLANSGYDGVIKALSTIVDAAAFSNNDKQRLVALVQSQQRAGDDDEELGAPAAAVYKSHSGGILDVIEDLKEKADEQLAEARKGETNSKHNFAMLKQSLEDSVAADSKDLAEQKAAKEEAGAEKAIAEGDLAQCVGSLEGAKNKLAAVTANCKRTAEDHAASEAARNDELKVIAEAKQVLAETSGGAVGQTYSLFQSTRSRLQTNSDLKNGEVFSLVKRLAKEHHSSALAQLASRIGAVLRYGAGAGEDPFAKIKGLISDMIARLQQQADAEATEKAYCDEQIAKTEEKKSDLDSDISKLTSKIDRDAARSASLKGEVKDLQAELANLAKQQAEMDKMRAETHAAFVQAKADLELGLEGVRTALSLLRDYFGGAAASAFLQNGGAIGDVMKQPAMPEMHTKAEGAGSSIIGILEVCESDFAKNLAAEETAEADAQSEYDKVTQANAIEKTEKEQGVKYKTQEFTQADKAVAELSKDRGTAQAELAAVVEYYDKIKERCIAKPETYEERKRRRTAEIAGLKEALKVLESETALFQRSNRNVRRHMAGFSRT